MKPPKKIEKITIRVEEEIKNDLQVLADSEQRKLSDYIRIELIKIIEAKKGKT